MGVNAHEYLIHGHVVRSAIPFASLSAPSAISAANSGETTVVIESPSTQPVRTPAASDELVLETPFCQIWLEHDLSAAATDVKHSDVKYSMVYPLHGFSFMIHTDGNRVTVEPQIHDDEWIQMLPVMACGAVLAFACRLLGSPALHANTVLVKGEAIAFAGESGAGKTLTSSLAMIAGGTLISDDVSVVNVVDRDQFVQTGLLDVRLRVDDQLGNAVAEVLSETPNVESAVTADERRSFQFERSNAVAATRLSRIVLPVLDPESTRFVLEPLTLNESIMALLKATRLTGWLNATFRSSDFLFVAELAERVRIERLRMPFVEANADSIRNAAQQLSHLLTSTAGSTAGSTAHVREAGRG